MSDLRTGKLAEWPYKVDYGKENEISTDVLILGGGVAGCHAAINAAKKGVKVAICEKGATIRSGQGGAGVDHWHLAVTNPCSKLTPDEMIELITKSSHDYFYLEYGNGITAYITCKESYDTLMDQEKCGLKVRDVDNEFEGAEFRDAKTKLLFAYDYDSCHNIRVNGGENIKVFLYKEARRLGVNIFDRVMVTSLLTEKGRQGARVVGATGVNTRTGQFYIFKAKATVLSTAAPNGLWIFSTEMSGSSFIEPNCKGEGTAMAWLAGAEMTLMERSGRSHYAGGFFYGNYSAGNAHNTWYACNIVDANGKEVPWIGRDGNLLKTEKERHHCAPGQKAFFHGARRGSGVPDEIISPGLIPDLPERIKRGEFILPLFADLPGIPPHERRALWGLMIPHEGKCRIIYDTYQRWGFDPDNDMLQVPVLPPDKYVYAPWWASYSPEQYRDGGFSAGSGVMFDWNLRSSLEGLYVAGQSTAAGGDHAVAACTGRYAGRNAAEYARIAKEPVIERKQVDAEKDRVYAPVRRKEGIGWKEFKAGLCRIMQDYCGEYKNKETLEMGLRWFASIKESEGEKACARNPHELVRTLECYTHITVGDLIMQSSLARKASCKALDFNRLDYPRMDPPEWNKLITLRIEGDSIKYGEAPLKYWLMSPYSADYAENYNKHAKI